MKYIILAFACCLVSTCGTVDTTYTSKTTGAKYHVAVDIPNKTTADAK